MKSTVVRRSAKGILALAALLAAATIAGSARAQSQAQFAGTFTLPYSAHWGKALLPAGEYELSVDEQTDSLVHVRNAKTGRPVAFEPITATEGNPSGASELAISIRGNDRVVYALRIGQLSETIVYNPKLARAAAEAESSETRAIPVTFARK